MYTELEEETYPSFLLFQEGEETRAVGVDL